jgi:hypothetical protein
MRGGTARKIIRSGYTFRSFSHNYLSMMAHMLKNQGWSGRIAAARSMRNVLILGGLTSIPFFKAFSEALMWAIGDDDEDAMTKIRENLPYNWLRDLVTYGLPGIGGIDTSGSLSIEFPRSWKDIIGVPYAIMEDTANTMESWKSGQKFRAISETPFTPMVMRNAIRGMDLYLYGQTTRSGRAISKPGEVEPIKLNEYEMFRKAVLGLQVTKLSSGYSGFQATMKPGDVLSRKKTYFVNRFVNAIRRGDDDAQAKVIAEVLKWNAEKIADGKPHLAIDPRKMIIERQKPGIMSIPKNLRGNALAISNAWQQ